MTHELTKSVRVRLTESERKLLAKTACENGVTQSRLLRKLIRESNGCGPDFFESELQHVIDATNQLRAIGNNLNQITRRVNSGNYDVPFEAEMLTSIACQSERLGRVVNELIVRSRLRWTPLTDKRKYKPVC